MKIVATLADRARERDSAILYSNPSVTVTQITQDGMKGEINNTHTQYGRRL